jgi:hypothetical protein
VTTAGTDHSTWREDLGRRVVASLATVIAAGGVMAMATFGSFHPGADQLTRSVVAVR